MAPAGGSGPRRHTVFANALTGEVRRMPTLAPVAAAGRPVTLGSVAVHRIDPLADARWDGLTTRHPRASIFHTAPWLRALRATYGYRPFALTTSAPGSALQNALVLCEIDSWVTGRRLVSLPFSDHCEPLVERDEQLEPLVGAVRADVDNGRWKYVEIRANAARGARHLSPASTYVIHRLALDGTPEQISRRFHKDCVQRKIRRATREGLRCEAGRSERLLTHFYELMLMTRVRHGLPPQPLDWFRQLIASMQDALAIRVAFKETRAVAAILTLKHNRTLVYKYGCSDKRFSHLGGTHLLFWNAVQEAIAEGLTALDMGRSDLDNQGLIDFKNRWGAESSTLTYLRYPQVVHAPAASFPASTFRRLMPLLPTRAVVAAGRLLYRHLG